MIDEFRQDLQKCVIFFRQGAQSEALQAYFQLTDELPTVLSMLGGEEQVVMRGVIQQLLLAQQKQDWVQVADLLWFELKPVFE